MLKLNTALVRNRRTQQVNELVQALTIPVRLSPAYERFDRAVRDALQKRGAEEKSSSTTQTHLLPLPTAGGHITLYESIAEYALPHRKLKIDPHDLFSDLREL